MIYCGAFPPRVSSVRRLRLLSPSPSAGAPSKSEEGRRRGPSLRSCWLTASLVRPRPRPRTGRVAIEERPNAREERERGEVTPAHVGWIHVDHTFCRLSLVPFFPWEATAFLSRRPFSSPPSTSERHCLASQKRPFDAPLIAWRKGKFATHARALEASETGCHAFGVLNNALHTRSTVGSWKPALIKLAAPFQAWSLIERVIFHLLFKPEKSQAAMQIMRDRRGSPRESQGPSGVGPGDEERGFLFALAQYFSPPQSLAKPLNF